MNSKRYLGYLVFGLLVGVAPANELVNSRPNIILVMTDDQGMGDLVCLGNPILKTPHLDRFYEKATRFTDFQVSPTCAPTRAAIMSGRHEFRVGVTHRIMQALDGRSLLPLLKNPDSEWADRQLFVHVGRWVPTINEEAKYAQCVVRTERWRFVNNAELYDISADPGETTDVSASYPEVVNRLRKSYDAWWAESVPLMVNEGVTTQQREKNPPLAVRYRKQLEAQEMPEWNPEYK